MGLLSRPQSDSRGQKNPNVEFEKLRTAAVRARLPYDREAWMNLAFYLDEHYIQWDADTGNIRKIPRPKETPNLPRPVVNKVMHYTQQAHASVLQDKPSADVLPASDDYLAIGDAEVAKAYCTYVSDATNANHDKQLSRAALWGLIAGNGWLKYTWNDRLKPNPRPDITAPSFFEVFPDPYAKDFAKARYVIHSQFMDVEQVYELWGVDVPAGAIQTADPMRTELLRGMGAAPVLNGVTVNELWYKPCRRYPDGLYVVWSGTERLTEQQKFPYDHHRLPFTQVGCIERPDSMFYRSPVSYLRSAQMLLNQYHAQRILNRQSYANPKWWVPAELELEELPSDKPMQILRGISQNGQLAPHLIQPQAMADNGDGAMIEEQMMHIVGLHEVSQAQVPGRVEAAKAIELLKESDEDRYKSMLDTIDQGITEGWYQILMLAKQYESSERMLQTYSKEGLPEVQRFKAERIDPGMRIQTVRMNGLGRTRAQRQDSLLLLWQNGVIQDPDLMADLMEVPIPSFTAPKALDMRLARNENLVLEKDNAIVPNSWDDHMIHIREHNNFRKTAEFAALSKDVKSKFEFHVQQHEQLQILVLQKQMQMQQAAMGAPPPGAGPPGQSGPNPPAGPPGGGQQQPQDFMDTPQAQAEMRTFTGERMLLQGEGPPRRSTKH